MSASGDRFHQRVSTHYMHAVEAFAALMQHAEKQLDPPAYARLEAEAYQALTTFELGAKKMGAVFRMYDVLSARKKRSNVVPFRRKTSKFPRPR